MLIGRSVLLPDTPFFSDLCCGRRQLGGVLDAWRVGWLVGGGGIETCYSLRHAGWLWWFGCVLDSRSADGIFLCFGKRPRARGLKLGGVPDCFHKYCSRLV